MNRNTQDLLVKLALVAGGAYALYWFFTSGLAKIGGAVGSAVTQVGASIGGGLYEWLHSNAAGDLLYYTITFPNGSRHAIPASDVHNGEFDYIAPPLAPTHWRIVVNAQGVKFAQGV